MVTLDTWRHEQRTETPHLADMHGGRNVRVFGVRGGNGDASDIDFLIELPLRQADPQFPVSPPSRQSGSSKMKSEETIHCHASSMSS
jgi:hypothetical protein